MGRYSCDASDESVVAGSLAKLRGKNRAIRSPSATNVSLASPKARDKYNGKNPEPELALPAMIVVAIAGVSISYPTWV